MHLAKFDLTSKVNVEIQLNYHIIEELWSLMITFPNHVCLCIFIIRLIANCYSILFLTMNKYM